jgi:hypothetical protein
MKKILLTYSGNAFSQGVFDFVRQLNSRQPVFLTGVFLPEVFYANLWTDAGMPLPAYFPLLDQEDEELQETMKQFKTLCQQHNIACRLHKDFTDLPQAEILKETRFADVLVVSSEKFYESFIEDELHPGLRDVLHGAECPVVVVPEQFQFPNRNILLYDGSASSVHAIKQFAYLFPELCNDETVLVYAKEGGDEHMPAEENIHELTARHFPNLQLSRLHLNPKDLKNWISEHERVMLVGGAFGRSGFSEVLRKSFMQSLITMRKFPVFIAHR